MKWLSITLITLALACNIAAADRLSSDFACPPQSAKPWVYYWFEGGYASKDGLARDFEEMKNKGIGGILHMQTLNSSGMPLPSEPKMLGDEWASWFGETARLAKNSCITMGASIVDGWGHGGPWVTAEKGAKKLVYSELQVDGPVRISQIIPQPETNLGVYQDVAVLAFPEKPNRPLTPVSVSASSYIHGYCGEVNQPASNITDNDPDTYWSAGGAPSALSPAWVQVSYANSINATGAYIVGAVDAGPENCQLQSSEDGSAFTTISSFKVLKGEAKQVSFAAVKAKHFRLLITSAYTGDVRVAEFLVLRDGDVPVSRHGIKWWVLKSGNRGYWRWPDKPYDALEEDYPADSTYDIQSSQITDLTAKMQRDGTLTWDVPSGRYTIMRFGWTPIGQPARMSSNGGYEVDVLNTAGADLMADSAQARMLQVTEPVAPGQLKVFHTDSWEIGADVGGQQPTWTNDFREQFKAKRGYDLLPYLPVMAQRLVDDRETSGRFLRDYRDTIADLLADYYGRQQQRAHQVNCQVNPESGYGTYPYPHMDGLKVFGRADLPMAESWHATDVMSCSDSFCDAMRTAASGARIYGRQLVQAETLTYDPIRGQMTPPEQYRHTLNHTFAEGINQVVIHKYVHQPFEYKPGLEDYGLFNRHYTWWPMADGFFSYISRCQSLLQQGLFAADAAYFVGEGASRFVPGKAFLRPALPGGYDYDGINAEVLLTRAAAKDGWLALPDGLSYRYLVLSQPQCITMSPEVLRKIRQLVLDGVSLVGDPPLSAPGLANRVVADAEIKALVKELWGPSVEPGGSRKVGKGRVIWGRSMEEILSSDKVSPDAESVEDRAGIAGANWIWHAADSDNPSPCRRVFSTSIDVPTGRKVAKALLSVTADNSFDIMINGREAGRGDDFHIVLDREISRYLRSGKNEIIVQVENGGDAPNPAGFIGRIVITLDDGNQIVNNTGDGSWTSSAGDDKWSTPRVVGAYGCAPWGQVDGGGTSDKLEWLHRRTTDADIYFVANPANRESEQQVALRCMGRAPELFDPLTGETRLLPDYSVNNGCTVIPMRFAPNQAFFIVFRKKAANARLQGENFPVLKQVAELDGPWQVKFDPAWVKPALGANGSLEFDKLTDWTLRPEDGIKDYSGIATYSRSFTAPNLKAGSRLYLSLGVVKEVARVRVNGKDMGAVWSAPWRVDITSALKTGNNTLEIDVANLWGNRVIADAALPEAERLTKGTLRLSQNDALSPSGLLGPVTLCSY